MGGIMTKKDNFNLIENLSKKRLIELNACTNCGYCVDWCPVVSASEDYRNTPMEKIRKFNSFVQRTHGLKARIFGPEKIDPAELEAFAEDLYNCTTCGRCGAVCTVGIHCQELWSDLRLIMRKLGYGPQEYVDCAVKILKDNHNPFELPIKERNNWVPDKVKMFQKADLAFFVGCELAYKAKPMAQGVVKLLNAANVPFLILEDEYCCGFPIYTLGDRGKEFELEVTHNIDGLIEKGVKTVAPYCPCCLGVMKRSWPEVKKLPFEIIHILKIISDVVDDKKLTFTKGFKGKVTYHDPCYLSRGFGKGEDLIDEPRRIINSIEGVKLIEMEHNRHLSLCAGSGGGLRRTNLELSTEMSIKVLKEAEDTGAELLLTACPAVYERFKMTIEDGSYKPKIKVMDILEFASHYL
jgi:heterodisulfide reductase subunit D